MKGRVWAGTDLELQGRLGHRSKGSGLPVRLLRLLPHHHIKTGRVLVAKDEAHVVVVCHCVDVKCSFEVNAIERRVTCR